MSNWITGGLNDSGTQGLADFGTGRLEDFGTGGLGDWETEGLFKNVIFSFLDVIFRQCNVAGLYFFHGPEDI